MKATAMSRRRFAAMGAAFRCSRQRDGLVAFVDQSARRQLARPGLHREVALARRGAQDADPGPILSNYVDLRDVADNLAKRGLDESTLNGIFIGNYARIVKQAMRGASATT